MEPSYIVCRGKDSKLKTTFTPVIPTRGCEIAVVGLSTYYSYPNVDRTNNLVNITGPGVTEKIEFEKGCYEVENLNDVVKKKFKWEKDKEQVVIRADPVTLRTHLNIHEGWKVNFPEENSIASIIGFQTRDYIGPNEFVGEKITNILKVNNILVQCDVIAGSTINGKPAPVIFNFSPNVPAGSKIVAEPVTPIYLPITLDSIQEFTVWVTDQDNELLDLQGEDLIITFHIRRR